MGSLAVVAAMVVALASSSALSAGPTANLVSSLTPTISVSNEAGLVAALASSPGTATSPKIISLAAGTYTGQIVVNQPYTELVGATGNAADVVITGAISAGTADPGGGTYGTSGSAIVTNQADNTTFADLTISNTGDPTIPLAGGVGTQAVALLTEGDRQVYNDVRLLGYQDTLYVDSAGPTTTGRVYFDYSYIEGAVDFIFGRATAVFAYSTIHALDRTGGTVVAPDTYSGNAQGFLFDHDRFISDTPSGGFDLGRAWPADTTTGQASLGQTTIENSTIDAGFSPTPWTDWTAGTPWQSTSRFSLINDTFAGAAPTAANSDSTTTGTVTAAATQASWLAGADGWNPVVSAPSAAPAAPTALSATATSSSSVGLSWSRGSDSTIVGYNVYRVAGSTPLTSLTGATPVNSTPLATGSYADNGLSSGATYSYTVVSLNAAGTPSALSATTTVVVTPAANTTVSSAAALSAALAAAPGTAYVIAIAPGTYVGPFTLGANNLTLTSTTGNAADVTLTGNNVATTSGGDTATLAVTGSNDNVDGITVVNTGANTGAATPAVHTTGTQDVFDNDVLSGANRAVYADSSYYASQSQQLYENTTISGDSSLVLGPASAVFDADTFNVETGTGVVLTPSTATTFPGLLVTNSTITPASGVTGVQLGEPYIAYPNIYTPNSVGKATVENSELGTGIDTTTPWGTAGYNSNTNTNTAAFLSGNNAEFDNTGPGAATAPQADRPQLSAALDPASVLGAATWYSLPIPPASTGQTAISGTVTAAVANTPLAGICVYLYNTGATGTRTSDPGACTDAQGNYTMGVASPGSYDVAFYDPLGRYTTTWSGGSATQAGATAVTVTTGQTTSSGASMSPVSGTSIAGTVTDAATQAPIAGVCVYLYTTAGSRTSDPGTCTNKAGNYVMAVASPGSYDVAFFDPLGRYTTTWSGGSTTQAGASSVSVTANEVTSGAGVAMTSVVATGIAGTVTDSLTHAPIAGICMYLYTTAGARTSDPGTCTNTAGNYVMAVANPGSYDVAFFDPSATYPTQWSGGAFSQAGATAVVVTAGQLSGGVGAAMSKPGSITGTVSHTTGGAYANVCVYVDNSPSGAYTGIGACTDSTGTFTLSGLAPGTYILGYYPPGQTSLTTNWYNNASSEATATVVTVASGATTTISNQSL